MIVVHHTHNYFGYGSALAMQVSLSRGVSFFFVLSGFILFYAHKDMQAGAHSARFIVARLARIWPLHLAMALFVVVAMPYPYGYPGSEPGPVTYAANLLLLHSWIPFPSFDFSLNSPSWSLATELFFYVSFPFLIRNWQQTRWIKLALCCGLGLCAVALGGAMHAPILTWGKNGMFAQGFVVFMPPARIIEFCLGMFAGSIWLGRRDLADRLGAAWTAIEFGICVAVVLGVTYANSLPALLGLHESVFKLWLSQISCAPLFALLIPVLAYGRGPVAKLLSLRPLILLGEISFALYLVHSPIAQILFVWPAFNHFGSLAQQMALYWAVSLVAAWGLWNLVEKPGRALILELYDKNRRIEAVPQVSIAIDAAIEK
jgi:peptidoglycan/LPS O-acetylase OafA/YrhL